ncbi:MAG: ferritin-like domain-containing protein [Nostoc sp.]|uniref:ferritin-like domain-containing protein n=1 Tax=Nostoc sp. TaxID=1180 RepID=UPI0025FC60B0|nr:ferritin-like domain-containing protein [Nostoc sp. NMS9]
MEHHRTPQYPYDTIGEMYDALIAGIYHVGQHNFSWNPTNQQTIWNKDVNKVDEKFKQQINNFDDVQNAVKTISLQGEGTTISKDRYAVPKNYRLEGEPDDANSFNEYSHYERLLDIKQQGLPIVYTTNNDQQNQIAQADALGELHNNFVKLLDELSNIWTGGDSSAFWDIMTDKNHGLIVKAQNCWKAGVIPKWC